MGTSVSTSGTYAVDGTLLGAVGSILGPSLGRELGASVGLLVPREFDDDDDDEV